MYSLEYADLVWALIRHNEYMSLNESIGGNHDFVVRN